jgi:glyoxylase-like metal-dependent hydrolase (beta-lactamase superfamily II)
MAPPPTAAQDAVVANHALRLEQNAPGAYFVDSSCIDCDLCRQIAPETFGRDRHAAQSIVRAQPAVDAARLRASMALVACPTSSIGSSDKAFARAAAAAFPEPIDGEVSFVGYASESSYGASSYLIRRQAGNVLVDSPRAAKPLLARIEALGGVATMFLTHRDDVADHAVFARTFGATRVLHAADVSHDTRDVERRIDGDAPRRIDDDLLAIPVPGHTRGSAALLYRDTYLFTGDHLWADDDHPGELEAGRGVCWYSWQEQTRSMERLLEHDFTWVLPGHGRRLQAQSPGAMRAAVERLTRRMRAAR